MKLIRRIILLLLFIVAAVLVYFSIGSEVTSHIDSYVYDLPYKEGESYKVVQGYGGRFSHLHIAALDFAMPEGTPVYAARGGVIYAYKDNSNEGGPFPQYNNKANYIMIRHPDGSYGCYWHLKKNGVLIKKGAVRKGELIGFSGSTGFVLRPHLHFSVKRKLNYHKDSFIRTIFRTTKGRQILKRGEYYLKPAK